MLSVRYSNNKHILFKLIRHRNISTVSDKLNEQPRINPVGIQYLSSSLQKQLFPKKTITGPNKELIDLSKNYLANNELLGKKCSLNVPISFKLPKLQGNSINNHFYKIGSLSSLKYLKLVENLLQIGKNPIERPGKWLFESGWYRYAPGEEPVKVDYPLENELVFDCEVMYKNSNFPIMATCLSNRAWYAWCSPFLIGESELNNHLIPLNTLQRDCLIIGHNVSYDRARILEEYNLEPSKAFFLDTMSLHVAVSGMCSRQRNTWMHYKKKKSEKLNGTENEVEKSLDDFRDNIENDELLLTLSNPILDEENSINNPDSISSLLFDDPWMKNSSLNSLRYVAELHCNIKMDKTIRNEFETLDVDDIRSNFQNLMNYCSNDVLSTYHVFNKIFPQFQKIAPHPVSFAALRHISQSFLPTDKSWEDYINRCEEIYQNSTKEIENKLHFICNDVINLKNDAKDSPWKNDPWLNQLNWAISPIKLTKSGKPFKNQKLPGYPEWYKKLIMKNKLQLTIKTRISPLLLKLSWEGKPIFWTDTKGWCFIVDNKDLEKYLNLKYILIDKFKILEDDSEDELVKENLIQLFDNNKAIFKIPHENGDESRVTSLMTKPFARFFENGILSSEFQIAKDALQLAISNSYWISSRERIKNQFVVYNENSNIGLIIPQVISMGTITRRAVEKTWLTASNAKKNRLGSELKSLIKAPPGYCFVGADVDSEELWIASLVGDSVFKIHGGTAIGWMTLEGTKNEGTDLHSKTAKILGISRNEAKVFNYGRIYGAGLKFATTLLKKFNPSISDLEAKETSKELYSATKGKSSFLKKVRMWHGGSESIVFNRLEQIAEQEDPRTPVLGAGITNALKRSNLKVNSFLPSRINWAIQSSGVDYLHLLLISVEYLCKIYKVDARLSITIHDEVRFLTKVEDKYKCAMILQIANLWTRSMFCYQLGIEDVPQSCAFFSSVDIDHVLRKEVDFDCITPSNPNPIPHGESLDIYQLLEKNDVKEMLNGLKDITLNEFKIEKKLKRPTEILDKDLDSDSRNSWIELQICNDEKEFKKLKNEFFKNVDFSEKKKFSKKLKNEDLSEEVECKGLFEENFKSMDHLKDAGLMVESEVWNKVMKNERKEKEKMKTRGKNKFSKAKDKNVEENEIENADDLFISRVKNMKNVKFDENVTVKKKKMKKVKPMDYQSSVSNHNFATDEICKSGLNTSSKSSELSNNETKMLEKSQYRDHVHDLKVIDIPLINPSQSIQKFGELSPNFNEKPLASASASASSLYNLGSDEINEIHKANIGDITNVA